jgi:fumarate hydratase subunit beta
MQTVVSITTPLTDRIVEKLKVGNRVLINGAIYSARDAAHKRLVESIHKGQRLPIDLKGQIIYYVGPTPPKPNSVIGSAGPTTSYRMDPYTPLLIEHGLKGMIGKGARSNNVVAALKNHKAIYFAAIGGAGALISKSIKRANIIAYEDLGTEAIRKMEVENFSAIVVNDIFGNDLYQEGRRKYREM